MRARHPPDVPRPSFNSSEGLCSSGPAGPRATTLAAARWPMRGRPPNTEAAGRKAGASGPVLVCGVTGLSSAAILVEEGRTCWARSGDLLLKTLLGREAGRSELVRENGDDGRGLRGSSGQVSAAHHERPIQRLPWIEGEMRGVLQPAQSGLREAAGKWMGWSLLATKKGRPATCGRPPFPKPTTVNNRRRPSIPILTCLQSTSALAYLGPATPRGLTRRATSASQPSSVGLPTRQPRLAPEGSADRPSRL
jgi:hypothetical protein